MPESRVQTSIAALVRLYVSRDPCLLECISRGIVNHSELARVLAGEIAVGESYKPSIAAVKMALHRLAKQVSVDRAPKVKRILAESALMVQDSVTVITVPREQMSKALSIAASLADKSRFIQVTQGFRTATIVIASEDAGKLLSKIGEPLEIIEDQAAIILVSPRDIIETPGFISFLTGYLSRQGINITQIISCYLDTIVVLDSKYASRAYRILHDLIDRLRKGPGI